MSCGARSRHWKSRRAAQTRRALLEPMNPYNTSVSGSSSETEGLWSLIVFFAASPSAAWWCSPLPAPRPPHPRRPGGAALAREAADADRTAVVLKGTMHLRPGPRPTTSPPPPVRQAARPQPPVHHRPGCSSHPSPRPQTTVPATVRTPPPRSASQPRPWSPRSPLSRLPPTPPGNRWA